MTKVFRGRNAQVALACAVVTIAILSVPAITFATRAPRMVSVTEALSAASALLVALLFFGRFRAQRRRIDMLLAHAFAAVGITELVCAVLPDLLRHEASVHGYVTWGRVWGGAIITVGLCWAAFTNERQPTEVHPSAWRLAGRSSVIAGGILLAVAALYRFLPAMAERGAPLGDGAGPMLADRFTVGGRLFSGLALLAVACAFERRYRRGGDPLLLWLASFAVLGGFARVHAFLYPVTGSEFVTTAHAFRLAANLVLAVAVAREIVRLWEAQAAQAVMADRKRIAHDLHRGLGNLAFITAQARWLRSRSNPDPRALNDLAEAAEEALNECRQAIKGLRVEGGQPAVAPAVAAAMEDKTAEATTALEALAFEMPGHTPANGEPVVLDLDASGLSGSGSRN